MRSYFIFGILVWCLLPTVIKHLLNESANTRHEKVVVDVAALGIKDKVSAAVKQLSQQNLSSLNASNDQLMILPTLDRLSSGYIARMLATEHGKNNSIQYSRNNVGTFTMSSPSIDGHQYLVNAYLEGYAPFAVDNVMTPLLVLSQRKHYQFDADQYAGREEVWQSSRQSFYYPRGDCEDHAIILADWLIEKGEDARVVLGDVDGGGHAWVVLFKNGKEYLLEATQKSGFFRNRSYPLAVLYRSYHPKFMFNRQAFWENTGTKFTTRYAGNKWVKTSRYIRSGY